MDKQLHRKIVGMTLSVALIAFAITVLLSQNIKLALGFPLGAIARLAGFEQIILMTNRIEKRSRPKAYGTTNYILRYIFYGVVIWLCLTKGVNVFTLLIGFVSMNYVIMLITHLEKRKGSE